MRHRNVLALSVALTATLFAGEKPPPPKEGPVRIREIYVPHEEFLALGKSELVPIRARVMKGLGGHTFGKGQGHLGRDQKGFVGLVRVDVPAPLDVAEDLQTGSSPTHGFRTVQLETQLHPAGGIGDAAEGNQNGKGRENALHQH